MQQLIFGQKQVQQSDGTWKGGEAIALSLDKLTHGHFIGKTGYGKSNLLAWLYVLLLSLGVNVGLIDPAGELSRSILKRLVATNYFDDDPDPFSRLLYLNVPRAHDEGRYLPFNILSGRYDPYTAADIVLKSFERVWPALQDGTSTNIEMLTRLGSFVMAYNKLPLLPYLEQFLTDLPFRQALLGRIDDALIERWFKNLAITDHARIADIVQTTLKRIYLLSFPPVVRYALSQKTNALDFDELLAHNRSFMLNLNLTDEEAQRLLGCLFTVQAETVAKARGRLPEEERSNRYVLILDEMQNFVAQSGDALGTIFAEARKGNVFLFVAHQYWLQLPESLRGALSQCGIIASFKVGHEDAKINVDHLEFPLDPDLTLPEPFDPLNPLSMRRRAISSEQQRAQYVEAIKSLPERDAFIRLPGHQLCRMRTLEVPKHTDTQRLEEVERVYLQRYFRVKTEIDQEIADTLGIITYSLGSTEHATLPELPSPVVPTPSTQKKTRSSQPQGVRQQVKQPSNASLTLTPEPSEDAPDRESQPAQPTPDTAQPVKKQKNRPEEEYGLF